MKKNTSQILKNADLRVTQQRKEVLDIFRSEPCSLSVDGLLNKLQNKNISINEVTLYRMVEDFFSAKLLRKLDFNDGKYRYEYDDGLNHHHHLICQKCGVIKILTEHCVNIDKLAVKKKYDFSIERHTLEFFGLCGECAEDNL